MVQLERKGKSRVTPIDQHLSCLGGAAGFWTLCHFVKNYLSRRVMRIGRLSASFLARNMSRVAGMDKSKGWSCFLLSTCLAHTVENCARLMGRTCCGGASSKLELSDVDCRDLSAWGWDGLSASLFYFNCESTRKHCIVQTVPKMNVRELHIRRSGTFPASNIHEVDKWNPHASSSRTWRHPISHKPSFQEFH